MHPSSVDYSAATTINAKFVVTLPSPNDDEPYETAFDIIIKHPCENGSFDTSGVSLSIYNTIGATTVSEAIPDLPINRDDGQLTSFDCGAQMYSLSSDPVSYIPVSYLTVDDTDHELDL